MHREGWGSFVLDHGLLVQDPKSKTFSIQDENSDVLYIHLREVTQLPEKQLSYRVQLLPSLLGSSISVLST